VSPGVRRLLLVFGPAVLAVLLIALYRSHRAEVEREAERDNPVIAASRVKNIQGGTVVVLDSATVQRIGLQVRPLAAASASTEDRLSGEVVPEPERTVMLRAPVTGRLSIPEGRSWPRLGTHVRAGQEIARVSDARPLSSPLSGEVLRVEAQPGEIVEAGQVLLEIIDNSHPVVRIPWTSQAGGSPPGTLFLQPPETSLRIRARLVGAAQEADPATRRPAYLYRAQQRWSGATPGTPVWALIPGPQSDSGRAVLVPASSVVQWEGLTWAYIQQGRGRYARVSVPTDRPVPGGWLAGPPLGPGDTVVVAGGQELLSEEFRGRVTVGEESGE